MSVMRVFNRFILSFSISLVLAEAFDCDGAGRECAVIYVGERCQGRSRILSKDVLIPDLDTIGFDNSIVSLVVTRSCALLLYDGTEYRGNPRMYLGNIADEQYYVVDDVIKNAASSARCRCNNTLFR